MVEDAEFAKIIEEMSTNYAQMFKRVKKLETQQDIIGNGVAVLMDRFEELEKKVDKFLDLHMRTDRHKWKRFMNIVNKRLEALEKFESFILQYDLPFQDKEDMQHYWRRYESE